MAGRFVLISCLVAGCATQAPPQRSDEPLENTYWKLTHLGAAPVTPAERQREAHFILHPADKRVSGSGGCNRMTGGYELQADRLAFKQMAGTMMACADGTDTEKAFFGALAKVARARVKQQQLELLDPSGSVVARFQAVHLRYYYPGDAESLRKAMEDAARQFPQTSIEIQRALEEGALVAVHSKVKHSPESRDIAVVHIMRFKGMRIVELWDVGMEAPESSPNQHGLF